MLFGATDSSARTGSFVAALALSQGEAVLLLRLVLNEETKNFVSISADFRFCTRCAFATRHMLTGRLRSFAGATVPWYTGGLRPFAGAAVPC